jgi:hypothetical protein
LPSSSSRSASASAIARTGSFTPVLECTQVTATARVRALTPSRTAVTMPSTEALEGSS